MISQSDPASPEKPPLRLHLRFRADDGLRGGGGGANARAARALGAAFDLRGSPDDADLQICSFDWEAPKTPARLFLDHGSFADASFWAYTIRSLRAGDTVVVTSRVCERVADRLLRPGSLQVINVPLPVDVDLFRPGGDRTSLRQGIEREHGIPSPGSLLLVAAGFVRRKNHHHAIDLMHALRRARPDCRLAIAGAVPDRPASRRYREQVESMARDAGLDGAVHFVGELRSDALARLMAASDALVHLSTCRLENFGLVAAEAAACGLPVLAADWGGLRDIVRHGTTGILAATWLSNRGPRVDWRSLVAPALALLDDRKAWKAMSAAARSRAEAEYSVAAHASRLRAAVESAAAWSRRAGGAVALNPEGEDLAFRTIALNASHPEIHDTGDEFRLLVPLEAGRYYRLLAGPAATFERVPALRRADRPAPLVRTRDTADGIEVTDPVWPSSLPLDANGRDLLRRCDGTRSLTAVLEESDPASASRLEALAQTLADEGILGPGLSLES